ncbi:DNA-binding transcriptional regulator, MarR family [Georgenia satyanarayanai]|uniref:DNA-binding transcriptional regulator, MarR family n=1 Tax=Georgenia satyanarayanai TaxID=860221 RepID=A0A2Y9A4R7_9MICO|nr:MarR family transcriptional regulator [Georgenia satyanarayanai]PYG00976.1 DNA-binding MarR family transcriptional regulator [Georgenia satyanarayanai]SSA39215.1 DNA-binding transcriptional regulator, MarR family [Georgenia satyanarayanai]
MIEQPQARNPRRKDAVTDREPDRSPGVQEEPTRSDGAAFPPPETWPTGRLLSAAARRVERAWDAYLGQWGLSHASVPVLVVLARGSLSQREIAAQMHVTEQTIGRVLRGLQASGHITRAPHPEDRRRHVVTLTPSGRDALSALDRTQSVEALIGSSLTASETTQLRVLLLRMLTDLPSGEDPDGA